MRKNIIKVNLNMWGERIGLLGVYVVSDDKPESVMDEFFEKLDEVVTDMGNTRDIIANLMIKWRVRLVKTMLTIRAGSPLIYMMLECRDEQLAGLTTIY